MSKAGRPKKGSTGLPNWFDIEKYQPVKAYKAISWYQQLVVRRGLFSNLQLLKSNATASNQKHNESWSTLLDLIKTDPIITQKRIVAAEKQRITIKDKEFVQLQGALRIISHALTDHMPGVRDTTNREIYQLYKSFPKKVGDYLASADLVYEGWDGSMIRKPGSSPKDTVEVYDFLNSTCDFYDLSLTTVDFSLPEEVLLNEFADYLREKRKNTGKLISPFFKNPDFTDWYNSGALPYLDLQVWEAITGETIHWPTFADALNQIVDKPISGDEALRKAAKSHAAKLIDSRTIRILQSQAAREKSGARKESGKLIVR